MRRRVSVSYYFIQIVAYAHWQDGPPLVTLMQFIEALAKMMPVGREHAYRLSER
jgi:hypothetical protein